MCCANLRKPRHGPTVSSQIHDRHPRATLRDLLFTLLSIHIRDQYQLVIIDPSTMLSIIEVLDDTHYSALQRAIRNLLDTNLAFATYAQIVDGLPTEDVAWDRSTHRL